MKRFRTKHGSTVEISGDHAGIVDIVFDWIAEGACIEARPICDYDGHDEARMRWWCACCGSREAKLVEVPND